MRNRFLTFAMLIALLAAFVVAPFSSASAAPAQPEAAVAGPFTGIPVAGTIPSLGGNFAGTLNITGFANQAGSLVANGTLTGTLTDALGNVIGTVTNVPVSLPVQATGTCQILHLVLGPLDLNLLGLTVHLNQVVLDITAQSGPGNLLGNLLCAVAHLLDHTPAPLNAITALLNRILGLLG